MEHDGCKGCAHEHEGVTGKHCVYCDGTKQGDMYKRATNADRIRSMTDEELARLLERFGSFNQPCSIDKGKPLNWLQEEVEE